MGALDNLQKNTKLMTVFLQAMQEDHLSRKDFTEAFTGLVKAIKDVKTTLEEETKAENKTAKEAVDLALSQALSELSKAESRFSAMFASHVTEMKSDARTTLRMIEQRLDSFEEQIPDDYDDTDLREMVAQVRNEIPEMPEAFDPSEIMEDIEELEKEIKELKKRPITTGGGVTNARIQQAFKYILKTEEPVGDIDGVNTTYTVSQPIFAVLAMSLNGEVIAELPNYTISGKTFTFSTALPAAYSGKDFEIKYV